MKKTEECARLDDCAVTARIITLSSKLSFAAMAAEAVQMDSDIDAEKKDWKLSGALAIIRGLCEELEQIAQNF